VRNIRRKEKAIQDRDEMITILRKAQYVTISTCKDNQPYLFTVSHGYDQELNVIYFHCAKEGKKIDYLLANNIIWGQALLDKGYVQGKCDHLYATCQFKGHVSFVEDIDEKHHALEMMIRQIDDNPEVILKSQLTAKSLKKVYIGKIYIDYMSGKKSTEVIIKI
jgi:nitroimidazol reductase NimA-like FMN-containing flavoprotein (pyridoxamine 5'-phosphate oxidase superfamily)